MRTDVRLVRQGTPAQRLFKALGIGLLVVGALAASSYRVVTGMNIYSKTFIAEGLVIAFLPIMLYIAARKPFIFPFALFVVLVPFDNLLTVSPHFGTLTKLVAICAGLAFVFWLIRNRRYVAPSKVAFVWLALLVWMSATVFWAIVPDDAISRLVTYAELIVLYLAISIMPVTLSDFRVFLSAVVFGGFAAAAYGIYQFHSGGIMKANIAHVLTSRVLVQAGEDRIDPNAFAAALLLPISIVVMLLLQRKWSLTKLGYIGVLLVLLGGVYVAASRGAMLALGALLVYLLFRSRYKAQVLFFSAVALVASLFVTNPLARFTNAITTGGAGRLDIWKVGWAAFKHHWLVGAGVGSFPIAYDQSFIQIYQSHYLNWHRAPHNTLLALGVELGIIGLCLGVIAWYGQWRMLSFIPKSDSLYELRTALEAAVIALSVSSLFLGILNDKFTWLAFGLMATSRTLAMTRVGSQNPAQPRPPMAPESDGEPLRRLTLKEPTHA